MAYRGSPIDILARLAKANVALIHVVGDADEVVPAAENTGILARRYRKLGGTIRVIHKPGIGHHPHGLDDPSPVVRFILKHAAMRRTVSVKNRDRLDDRLTVNRHMGGASGCQVYRFRRLLRLA